MNINKVAEEKCGIKELIVRDGKMIELMNELNKAKDPALIMILCDKVTDLMMGYDTDGFTIK